MKLRPVEGSWEEGYPVNWEFIGMVAFGDEGTEPPKFITIDGVRYDKSNS